MIAPTFAHIKDLAFALPIARNDLNNAIQCMVIDAEESAMLDGGAPMAYLQCNLCFCDPAISQWYTENGVTF